MSNLPVLMLTAAALERDKVRGLRGGAGDYITKPFRTAIVMARGENHLNLKRYQDLLKRQSTLDGLTGLPNRRAFDELIEQEWRRGARLKTMLSLIMLDVDHFKQFNDHYGHLAGDDCLRQVGQELASVGRSIDFVGRYGGEEFACILPHTDLEGAEKVAERLKKAIIGLGITHEYSSAASQVTISMGVATALPVNERDPEELIDAADKMLYEAKGSGRNCARSTRL